MSGVGAGVGTEKFWRSREQELVQLTLDYLSLAYVETWGRLPEIGDALNLTRAFQYLFGMGPEAGPEHLKAWNMDHWAYGTLAGEVQDWFVETDMYWDRAKQIIGMVGIMIREGFPIDPGSVQTVTGDWSDLDEWGCWEPEAVNEIVFNQLYLDEVLYSKALGFYRPRVLQPSGRGSGSGSE